MPAPAKILVITNGPICRHLRVRKEPDSLRPAGPLAWLAALLLLQPCTGTTAA